MDRLALFRKAIQKRRAEIKEVPPCAMGADVILHCRKQNVRAEETLEGAHRTGARANEVYSNLTTGPAFLRDWGASSSAYCDHVWSLIPQNNIGKSEDVSATAVFLAFDKRKYMTGGNIYVTGGKDL